MYAVSNEYINKIMGSSVRTEWSGTIALADGHTYAFTGDDLAQGQAKLTRAICGGDSIEIGSTCAAEFDFAIYLDVDRYALYGATITLNFTLYMDNLGSRETVPCGIFTITEPPTRYLGVVTIHAYDNMQKFDRNFGKITSGLPYDILLLACVDCGVELGMTARELALFPNGQRETQVYQNATVETYRDLVGYVASYIGGYAVIGVNGKLYIRQYGMQSVRTISSNWRYDYRPQDYETYYSSVSAVSMEHNVTETVAKDDGGLIYGMGENPLLQFQESTDRRAALGEILEALSSFRYTPFTAKTPCDPALDVGDVIDFSDGLAVSGKMSAITSITLTINGGMELECVGGNPNSSSVRTKTDKTLSEMRANTSSAEIVTYGYTNAKEVRADNRKRVPVMQLLFTTAGKTPKIDIWMEILLDTVCAAADGLVDLLDPMSVTVTYALNGTELPYSPVETYAVPGKHILSLHYFIPEVDPDTRYTWTVYLTMYNGTAVMDVDCIHAFLSGQGLVSDSDTDGLGMIDASDEVYSMMFHNTLNVIKAVEAVSADIGPVSRNNSTAEAFRSIKIHGHLGRVNINTRLSEGEGVTYIKTADFITTADVLKMTVDRDYVEITDTFALRTEYNAESKELVIDSGHLCVITAETENFRTVESVVVTDG